MSYMLNTPGSMKVDELVHLINHQFPQKVSHRHIPHSFCYVCSKLDPGGRFMGNPYKYLFGRGYLQRCEHVPPTPHPTMLNETRQNTPASDDGKFFDTGVLNKDSLPKSDKNMFKVSPVFDKHDLRNVEEGRFLPFVSENTFLTTYRSKSNHKRNKVDGRLSLPSLTNGGKGLISRDFDGGSNGSESRSQDSNNRLGRRASYSIGDDSTRDRSDSRKRNGVKKKKKVKETFSHPSGIGPWGEEEFEDGGVLKYKHRKKEDWVKYAGPSDLFEDGLQQSDPTRIVNSGKELTFEFHRRGTFSVSPSGSMSISGETTLSSPDFLISRIHSANWCECPEIDISLLRCKECFQTGGHEKWCVSKMGICPNCGKPVRRKKHQGERTLRQSTLSPSKTPGKSETELSFTSHNREECSSRRRDNDNRVRFHAGNSFVKESKRKHGGILKQEKERVRFADDTEKSRKKKISDETFNPALPRVDPNIHRQAYVLALADSRVKKMRKDAFAIENAQKRRYFSYFPLYKHPQYKPHPNSILGIRAEEENGKKLKIKKAMKHILGDIQLADYYPTGKNFPKDHDNDKSTTRQL